MASVPIQDVSWDRMIRAVEKVRERLTRVADSLERAGIPYAVVGGNAIAAWVARVDESAVRNTQDVDLVIRREDLEAVKTTLAAANFHYRHSASVDMFLDGPDARARDAVHVVFAGEKVRPDYVLPVPDVSESEAVANFRLIRLEPLVRMKLTSFRLKDRVHIQDLINVGLVDASWLNRLPTVLAARLKEILDDPDG